MCPIYLRPNVKYVWLVLGFQEIQTTDCSEFIQQSKLRKVTIFISSCTLLGTFTLESTSVSIISLSQDEKCGPRKGKVYQLVFAARLSAAPSTAMSSLPALTGWPVVSHYSGFRLLNKSKTIVNKYKDNFEIRMQTTSNCWELDISYILKSLHKKLLGVPNFYF